MVSGALFPPWLPDEKAKQIESKHDSFNIRCEEWFPVAGLLKYVLEINKYKAQMQLVTNEREREKCFI